MSTSKDEQVDLTSALVARLLRGADGDCEIVGFSGSGRCIEPAVAARFDGLFIDLVCAEHAERSRPLTGTQIAFPPGGCDTDCEIPGCDGSAHQPAWKRSTPPGESA